MNTSSFIRTIVIALSLASITPAMGVESIQDVARILAKHRSVWTTPPKRTPTNYAPDGPLLGNGDMKAAIGGPAHAQSFYLSKNDLWYLKSQYSVLRSPGFGCLTLSVPQLKGASYNITQMFQDAITTGRFGTKAGTLQMKSFVVATENLLVVELTAEDGSFDVGVSLTPTRRNVAQTHTEQQGEIGLASKEFSGSQVDIPSGYAVAWKVLGETSPAPAGIAQTASLHVQLGREFFQGQGRWGFHGAIDDLCVYDRVLSPEDMTKWVSSGKAAADATQVWSADTLPAGATGVTSVPGKRGQAWQLAGGAASFVDCGKVTLPLVPVTLGGWIRIDSLHKDANYILSCGAWNEGLSLGLSSGHLRFMVKGKYLQSDVLPTGRWLHVAGTYDGSQMVLYVDGKEVQSSGATVTHFTVRPGHPVTLVAAMDSLFKSPSYKQNVIKTVAAISEADLFGLAQNHAAWWADYWAKSYVEFDEPLVEGAYYRSLYTLGAASRDPEFPPGGIFGWSTTDAPGWGGAYWMNYNHVAPFHALVTCNRLEQHDPQDTPLLQFMDEGRRLAKVVTHARGILYPVGIGPMGTDANRGGVYRHTRNSEGGTIFHQQRSNAAYGAVNMIQRWYGTYDLAYGKKVYPYIREVATFWEDYLKFEPTASEEPQRQGGGLPPEVAPLSEGRLPSERGATADAGRYMIYNDAIHEGSGKNTNPILSLGLVQNTMAAAIDISRELGVDADRREKWQHIIDHISGYSVQTMQGKTVFRYTERGTPWWRSGTLGLQQIYPANTIGLDSNPALLTVARNTALVMQRWHDGNGSSSMFPAAVRIGLDPHLILAKLVEYAQRSYPNGFQLGNITGIENCSTTPNTINEMLCMSHVSVGNAHLQGQPETRKKQIEGLPYLLRLFPVWPKEKDARFVNIRTWGAFLVSAELKSGVVTGVKIVSEKGRDCTLQNPWPGKKVKLTGRETLAGDRFTFKTKTNETIECKQE